MDVTLTPEVQRFVEEKVKSGQYGSADEAVNRLLALVKERESLGPEDIEELRSEVDAGIEDADRGRFVDYTAEDVIAQRRAALAGKRTPARGSERKDG